MLRLLHMTVKSGDYTHCPTGASMSALAMLRQLFTESSGLEKLLSPPRPLLVSATQHETKFAVRRQSVRWHGARSEEIESPFQRVLGMPGCHDHIVLTLSTEPSLAQFIID